ncbi:MAG: tRNA1(Val) (adenine(37)-N6)-methyltransferase [Nitrospirota bacterium]
MTFKESNVIYVRFKCMDVTLDSIRDIRLYQPKRGYRFSADALLLYDFVNLKNVRRIADLGAGSGIVGILLAKTYPDAEIILFEIQDSLATLADKNITLNSLEDRVRVIKTDIRILTSQQSTVNSLQSKDAHQFYVCDGLSTYDWRLAANSFDLVVSNPPFRRPKSGFINIGEEKAIAKHEIKLRLHELIDAASYLLRAKGRFCMVYHPCRLSELMEILKKRGLEPKRLRFVHSSISSEAKMILLEAIKGGKGGIKVEKPLYIYRENGSYTDEVEKIYNL